jgi:hypothetical protein
MIEIETAKKDNSCFCSEQRRESQRKIIGPVPESQKECFGYLKYCFDLTPGNDRALKDMERHKIWYVTASGFRASIVLKNASIEQCLVFVIDKINKFEKCKVKYA